MDRTSRRTSVKPSVEDTGDSTGQKRKRLSHACKACRSRKVRCDERIPACTNCAKLRIECITDDPRRPHVGTVTRIRASSTRADLPSSEPPTKRASAGPSVPQGDAPKSQRRPAGPLAKHDADDSHDLATVESGETSDGHGSFHAASPWADPAWIRSALGGASASIISDAHAHDRFKYVGSSNLQVFSQWIDLLLARQHHSRPTNAHSAVLPSSISDHFDHGRVHSEEHHFPLHPPLPALTPLRNIDAILTDFFNDANAVFPIFDQVLLRHDLTRLIQHLRLDECDTVRLDLLSPYDVPLLATLYSVTVLGLLDAVPRQQAQVKAYLDAAYSLYGHMLGVPYLASVQAFLLLHLALRAMSKDGAAWQVLGSAIRVAYSIGLHRASASPPLHSAELEATKARVWWCCYTLDRVATLDSGRPTMINDLDVQLPAPRVPRSSALPLPENADDPSRAESLSDQAFEERYLASLVDLCRLKAEIHSRLYTSRKQSLDEAQLFSIIARMDQKLMDWSSSCLAFLQLTTIGSEEALRAVSKKRDLQTLHLLCTYHFTVINVHRASIMLDTRLYQYRVAHKLANHKDRLLSAETICRGAARTIIRCIKQFRLLHQCTARMVPGTIPLSAVYVLAICIFKHPNEWSVPSDLALIESIAKTVVQDYRNDGMPAEFTSIFATLQRLAAQCVRRVSSRPPSPPPGDLDDHQAKIGMELLWESLGFGQVLPSISEETYGVQDVRDNADTVPAPAGSTGAQSERMTPTSKTEALTAEVPSLLSSLELDDPDLLSSLLGLPGLFTHHGDGAAEEATLGVDDLEP